MHFREVRTQLRGTGRPSADYSLCELHNSPSFARGSQTQRGWGGGSTVALVLIKCSNPRAPGTTLAGWGHRHPSVLAPPAVGGWLMAGDTSSDTLSPQHPVPELLWAPALHANHLLLIRPHFSALVTQSPHSVTWVCAPSSCCCVAPGAGCHHPASPRDEPSGLPEQPLGHQQPHPGSPKRYTLLP